MTYVMAIHTQGLDNEIRCAMCTNSMKSDRGCDGGCIVDNEMYKRVMNTINNHIFKQEPCEDAISRQAVFELIDFYDGQNQQHFTVDNLRDDVENVLPVIPKGVTVTDFADKCRECGREKVLDKIRAEIEQERIGYPPSADYYKAIMKCLQIIDKYRESEG